MFGAPERMLSFFFFLLLQNLFRLGLNSRSIELLSVEHLLVE
jgi:hypothetical protein